MKKFLFLILFLFLNITYSNDLNLTQNEKEYIKTKQRVYVLIPSNFQAPFIFKENTKYKGYFIDVIKLISSKVNLEPVFVEDNVMDLDLLLKNRSIDLIPAIKFNPKFEDKFIFTKDYYKESFSLITKLSTTLQSIDDLKNKKIGILKNLPISHYIRYEYSEDMRIIEFNEIDDLLEAVKSGFVDATILNNMSAAHLLKENSNKFLKISSSIQFLNYDDKLVIGIDRRLNTLASIFSKVLTSIDKEDLELLETTWLNKSKDLKLNAQEIAFLKNNIIKVAYTDNWAPFSFLQNQKPSGLGFDFWEYIVEKNQIKYQTILQNNFTDALNNIKEKKLDIILTTSQTKDREQYSIFSDVYYKSPIGIATLQNRDYIPNIEEIFDKKIGVGKNFSAHKLLKEKYPNLKFVFIKNTVDGLEKLSNNEIFALVDIMPVLSHNIEKHGYTNIKISGSAGVNLNLQMMLRKDFQILKSIIDKSISNMTFEEKKKIYDKWANNKYGPKIDYLETLKFVLPVLIVLIVILYKNKQLLSYQKKLKITQEELENTVTSFKTLVDLTVEGIFILEHNKVIFSNNEASKIFNKDAKFMNNVNIVNFFDTESKKSIVDALNLCDGKNHEVTAIKDNDIKFPCLLKARTTVFNNKKSTIITIIDLSEIKEKEKLLLDQSKMASLGEMIGNIAHQWRQPLSIISTSASGLKLQKEFNTLNDEIFSESLDNITETTKFLSQTIDDFQDYLKKDKSKSTFKVKSNIEAVLNILNSSFKANEVKVSFDLDDNLEINTYSNELKQVVLNVLNNSKDALKALNKNQKRYLHISLFKKEDFAIIEVIDNGGGIDEEIIDKIYEPYFTTKHKSQGTGLGLYMTHKIVYDSIGGKIELKNCTFIFDDIEYPNCTIATIEIPLS